MMIIWILLFINLILFYIRTIYQTKHKEIELFYERRPRLFSDDHAINFPKH